MSVKHFYVLARKLHVHVLISKLCLMATGQSRKKSRCQSSVSLFWRLNLVWWPLCKAGKPRMSVWRFYALIPKLHVHVLIRKLRLMATRQSRKNLGGGQSSGSMFWHVNFVWWPLGKAGCQSRVFMFWYVNFMSMFRQVDFFWWPLGVAVATQDESLVFPCFDAEIFAR